MRKISILLFGLSTLCLAGCNVDSKPSFDISNSGVDISSSEIDQNLTQITYSNPLSFVVGFNDSVGFTSIADPYVIQGNDGYFYLVASNANVQVTKTWQTKFDYGPIWRSSDLSNWRYLTSVFPNQANDLDWLTFEEEVDEKLQVNAPCLANINGLYIYYYGLTKGYDYNPGIGLAIADSMEGPWVNMGKLFRSDEIGVANSSDPDVFVDDDGKVYMSFGSGDGIWLIELTEDGTQLKGGIEYAKNNKKWIAGEKDKVAVTNNYEGANITKHNGSYYLYLSTGGWSGGVNSKYHTLVGKASSIKGPYFDSIGRDLKQMYQGDDVLLPYINKATGVGHSCIYTDETNQEWIFYHGYDQTGVANPNIRILYCDKIQYNNLGMPYVENHTPKYGSQEGPYVKETYNE